MSRTACSNRAQVWLLAAVAALPQSLPDGPLEVSPDPIEFGVVEVGTGKDSVVSVLNVAGRALTVVEVRLHPGDGALFIDGDECTGSLADDQSCEIVLRFMPVDEGRIESELVVVTDAGETVITVSAFGGGRGASGTDPTTPQSGTEPPETEPPETDVAETEPAGTEPAGTEPAETAPPGGPLTSVAPTTPPIESELDDCERRVRDLDLDVAFVPARTMIEGESYTVGISVAIPGGTLATPPGAGTSPTSIVTFPAVATCVVSARLIGADFEITPPEPQEQSFLRGRTSLDWSWQVVPTKPGDLVLQALITPIIATSDGKQAGANEAFDVRIAVAARPAPDRSFGYRVNEVIGSPVGGALLGVLLAGVSATGVVSALKKRQQRRIDETDPPDRPD